jgi:hypothetical protein
MLTQFFQHPGSIKLTQYKLDEFLLEVAMSEFQAVQRRCRARKKLRATLFQGALLCSFQLLLLNSALAEDAKARAVRELLTNIQPAIQAHSGEYPNLKKRVANRLLACSFVYHVLSSLDNQYNSYNDDEKIRMEAAAYSYSLVAISWMDDEAEVKAVGKQTISDLEVIQRDRLKMLHLLQNCQNFFDKTRVDIAVTEVGLDQ